MTVYTGGILEGLDILQAAMDAIDNFETASRAQIAPLAAGAQEVTEAIDAAMATLDAEMDGNGSGGLAGAVPGALGPEVAVLTRAHLKNIDQMVALTEMRGYAGRILLNLKKAGR